MEASVNKLIGTTLVSACLSAIIASTAFAQPTPNLESRSTAGPGRNFAQRPFSRPTERVEARLAYVKTALKITDAQQSQWDAYANVVRKNAQEMEQKFRSRRAGAPGRHQRPNAIERLEREQSFHAEA